MRKCFLTLFLPCIVFYFSSVQIALTASDVDTSISLLREEAVEIKKEECDRFLKELDKEYFNNKLKTHINNKEQLLGCYQAFRGDKLWRAYGDIGLAYLISERAIEAAPYLEKALLHIPETATLTRDDEIYRFGLTLTLAISFGIQKDFDQALKRIKEELPAAIELCPAVPVASFFSSAGWIYASMDKLGPGIFYAKLVAAGNYAEGANAAEDKTMKGDLNRYLYLSCRVDEIALFDKLPTWPSPEDISPFSPARVLMVGPEIALFDRFERLAVALQEAAASDDPATLHAARENMRAWMDEVERELK